MIFLFRSYGYIVSFLLIYLILSSCTLHDSASHASVSQLCPQISAKAFHQCGGCPFWEQSLITKASTFHMTEDPSWRENLQICYQQKNQQPSKGSLCLQQKFNWDLTFTNSFSSGLWAAYEESLHPDPTEKALYEQCVQKANQ